MTVFESDLVRKMDEAAIASGVPSFELMDRAAFGLFQCACRMLGTVSGKKIVVFSGTGNNGGDGLAFALIAQERGANVQCYLTGKSEKMTPDTFKFYIMLRRQGIEPIIFQPNNHQHTDHVIDADLIIDAIFGIGFRGSMRGISSEAVKVINSSKAPVISADIPSGAEADTGLVSVDCIRADHTVTFTCLKPALCLQPAKSYCGEVTVHDIGIPKSCIKSLLETIRIEAVDGSKQYYPIELVDEELLMGVLPKRKPDSHKGNYAKVLVVGGCIGFTGAPYLSAMAAFRTGAGLVYMAVPDSIYTIEAVKCNEIICLPFESFEGGFSASAADDLLAAAEKCDVCVIGPGLGLNENTVRLTEILLEGIDIPIVLDADGINAVSKNINILAERASKGSCTILTPHDVEFARLGGDLSAGRVVAARSLSVKHGAIVVLKGNTTVTALPNGKTMINTSGNPGMAKGGSGDILAGMIGSLVGQGLNIESAVPAAVYFHGAAGDSAAKRLGEYGMLPVDLLSEVPVVLKKFESTSSG